MSTGNSGFVQNPLPEVVSWLPCHHRLTRTHLGPIPCPHPTYGGHPSPGVATVRASPTASSTPCSPGSSHETSLRGRRRAHLFAHHDRRDEWIEAASSPASTNLCLEAFEKIAGLELENLTVHGVHCQSTVRGARPRAQAPWTAANKHQTLTPGRRHRHPAGRCELSSPGNVMPRPAAISSLSPWWTTSTSSPRIGAP